MNVIKLSNRKVVVSENGVSKVLTSPCGVYYDENTNRWGTHVLDENGDWKNRSFGVMKHGPIEAFEMAVAEREKSLTFLLNRRLLPRIRHLIRGNHSTTIREIDGFFVVRDPVKRDYHKFKLESDAKNFNLAVTDEWKLVHRFDKLSMIRIEQGTTRKRPDDAFSRQFQAEAARLGI